MTYRIVFHPSAEKQLRRIPRLYAERIREEISLLASNPNFGKKLDGKFAGLRSLRVWPYRVLYEVFDDRVLVIILEIGHRQGVYK